MTITLGEKDSGQVPVYLKCVGPGVDQCPILEAVYDPSTQLQKTRISYSASGKQKSTTEVEGIL